MALQLKVLGAKPEDLSLLPRTYTVRGEKKLQQVFSDLLSGMVAGGMHFPQSHK